MENSLIKRIEKNENLKILSPLPIILALRYCLPFEKKLPRGKQIRLKTAHTNTHTLSLAHTHTHTLYSNGEKEFKKKREIRSLSSFFVNSIFKSYFPRVRPVPASRELLPVTVASPRVALIS